MCSSSITHLCIRQEELKADFEISVDPCSQSLTIKETWKQHVSTNKWMRTRLCTYNCMVIILKREVLTFDVFVSIEDTVQSNAWTYLQGGSLKSQNITDCRIVSLSLGYMEQLFPYRCTVSVFRIQRIQSLGRGNVYQCGCHKTAHLKLVPIAHCNSHIFQHNINSNIEEKYVC